MSCSYRNAARYARSRTLYSDALELIPGGVNSTARAVWSGWDPHPLFAVKGAGARIWDADANVYIDYLLGLGPMLFGHCPAKITAAVVDFIQSHGTVFALPHAGEIDLAKKITVAVPSVEQVRLCNTGTEAVLYAVRLARAFTRRAKLIRFEGMYHGFSDAVYWSKHPPLETAGTDEFPVPYSARTRASWRSRGFASHPPLEQHRCASRRNRTSWIRNSCGDNGAGHVQYGLHTAGTWLSRGNA